METTGETSGVGGASGVVSREKEGESCCKIDDVLRKNPEMRIVITDAGKASDGGANFIAYTIEVGVTALYHDTPSFPWNTDCC